MLGERLYELRRKKNLSQEEVAEKLNVSRQTISKWETNQSQPDFDKIIPICTLYEISSEELLTGNKAKGEKRIEENESREDKKKTALVVSFSVFLYFLAVIWIILFAEVKQISENVLIGVFLLIVSISTCLLVFHFVCFAKEKECVKKNKKYEQYDGIVALVFTILYLGISFWTSAWHITWILWIVFSLVIEMIHLYLKGKEDDNE